MAYETIVKEGNFYQSATGDYGFRLLEGGESSTAGEAFRAIQALTPKNVREMMMEGHDWVADLPDDVRPKAVEMEELIAGELAGQLLDIYEAYSKVAHIKERKEYARVVTVQYPAIASYLFSLRDGKFREEDVLRKLDLRFLQEAI